MKPVELNTEERVVEERQVKKGQKYLGSVYLKPGQKVWEFEPKTGLLQEATYDTSQYDIQKRVGSRKITQRDGCLYIPAISWSAAKKKLGKHLPANYQFKKSV